MLWSLSVGLKLAQNCLPGVFKLALNLYFWTEHVHENFLFNNRIEYNFLKIAYKYTIKILDLYK